MIRQDFFGPEGIPNLDADPDLQNDTALAELESAFARVGGIESMTWKIGDRCTYEPSRPLAPWVIINAVGATGTVTRLHDDGTLRLSLDRGGYITVGEPENLAALVCPTEART